MSGGGVFIALTENDDIWPNGESNAGRDSILGLGGNDSIDGGAGNDWLNGGTGNDTLIGGNGTDWADYADAAGAVTVQLGDNNLSGAWGTSSGAAGVDSLSGIEAVRGGSGDDSLMANETGTIGVVTSQTLDGGLGNDTLVNLGARAALLIGGDGDDRLVGNGFGQSGDTLDGGIGNDTITIGSTNGANDSYILGGAGDDSLRSGAMNDTILGGADNDTVSSAQGNDCVLGEAGRDTIWGFIGDDTLDGGADNDTLEGHRGNDSLLGGDGSDWAVYGRTFSAGVTVDLGSAAPFATGDGEDLLSSIENLIGSNFSDSLVGDAGANTIIAGNGTDTLAGGAGNDWMDFGDGNENYLRSVTESGNDTLIGGIGNNTLDLGSNWEFLNETGGFSLYRDENDTIYAQQWQVVCFAEGTRVVTPNGEDAVENLRAGDMVLAMRDGQAGFEALRWVGFMDVAVPRDAAMAAKTAPVLIKAGALAAGMPARDLRVSPDHAMEVDGHLIPAKHLVNGESIIQETWCRKVRYFHLELEAHGLLLSEGTWSESYLDDGNRHAFNNAALTGLFLDFEAGRSKGQYDHQACLPVLRQGLKLDEIHGRLAHRAQELAGGKKFSRRA